jgi:hypothetical protein
LANIARAPTQINEQIGARNIVGIETHWSFLAKGNLPIDRIKTLPQQLLKGPALLFARKAVFFFART